MHLATKNIDQFLQLTPFIQALFIICCAVDFALTLYFVHKTIAVICSNIVTYLHNRAFARTLKGK